MRMFAMHASMRSVEVNGSGEAVGLGGRHPLVTDHMHKDLNYHVSILQKGTS